MDASFPTHFIEMLASIFSAYLTLAYHPPARWPTSSFLASLAARFPERHPVEPVWAWLRPPHWTNRLFKNDEAILQTCGQAWNPFTR